MSTSPIAGPPERSAGKSSRLQGLDAARAIAIIGMLAVNVGPKAEQSDTGFAVAIYDLPNGRASLLFMILAGVGMSLMTRRARESGAPLPLKTIVWRALLLAVGGLALQLLGHDLSIILTYYGVLFFCGLPLLRAPTWLVSALAGVTFVLGPLTWLVLQQVTATAFDFDAPSFEDPLWTMLHATLLTGAYPVVVWISPFLLGMTLGRLKLSDRRLQWRLTVWGGVATVTGAGVSIILIAILGEPSTVYGWDHLVSAAAHSQMPLWLLSSGGSAVLVIGLFLLAEHLVRRRLSMLVSAGRLALTIYVAHLVVIALVVRPGPDALVEGYIITAVMSVFFVVAAHVWWRTLGTGPLERLLSWPPRLITNARSTSR